LNSSFSSTPEHDVEVWQGDENLINKLLEVMYSIENQYDVCIAHGGLNAISSEDRIRKAYHDLQTRGVALRIITEITKDNLEDCKVLSEIAQIRHLSEMRGNFAVADKRVYASIEDLNNSNSPIIELITSTVPTFVKQQQYFFDLLWSKSVPFEQHDSEMEDDIIPNIMRVLTDPSEILNLTYRLLKEARKEILVIFYTANALVRQEKAGAVDLVIESAIKYKTQVKILLPIEDIALNTIRRLEETNGIQVRHIESIMQTMVTIVVVDRTYSIAVELKDDTKENSEEVIGLATFSNSKSTVLSYVSMFENYMRLTELYKESQSRLSSKTDELEAMKQYLNEVLEEVDKFKKTK
jgi:two-component system sensor histidine kinase VicK